MSYARRQPNPAVEVLRNGSEQPRIANSEQWSQRQEQERQFSADCRKWLDDHHVTKPGMTQPERMRAMAAYRTMLKHTFRKADAEPRAWAHSLKTDYLAGVPLLQMQISMASEALNEVWENRECKPRAEASNA